MKAKAKAGEPAAGAGAVAGAGAGAVAGAAARRAEQRAQRVAGGLAELREWLRDQVRLGFAATASRGGTGAIAARMVDAQAPGVAGVLRGLTAVQLSGEGWPTRLLGEYGMLHLLTRAHERIAELPPELAAVVRSHIGYTTSRQDVLTLPPVTDHWLVTAVRDLVDGTVPGRRV
ncbi:MAG TPA: SWIM zinc finger family protein, partial [Trebonia sp.]